MTKDEATVPVEILLTVDGTTWVDMTGKPTLFETDATEATVVTVALLFCLVDECLVPKERPL